jgi:hypothetical protein
MTGQPVLGNAGQEPGQFVHARLRREVGWLLAA